MKASSDIRRRLMTRRRDDSALFEGAGGAPPNGREPGGLRPGPDLLDRPILSTLIRLATPMLGGIVAIMLFNLADTYFVSCLGTRELAAISFTFPIIFFIHGITLGLSMGATAVLSRRVGAGDMREVRLLTRDGLLLAVLVVAIFTSAGLLSMDPVFRLLGAEGEILELVKDYMRIWYLGIVFIVVPMVGNGFIRATGNTATPALIMGASAGCNILLDPLLIFGLGPVPGMGITGAAIATVISRLLVLILALWVLRRQDLLDLSRPRLRPLLAHWWQLLHIGAPAALNNVMLPVSLAVLTYMIAGFGYETVAAFGAGGRIQQLAGVTMIAWSAGLTPFVGQNWGAGRNGRVISALRLSKRYALLMGAALYCLIALCARPLAGAFTEDEAIRETTVLYLRFGLLGFPMTGVVMMAASAFNALRQPFRAVHLNLLRLFVFLLPAAWLAGRFWGPVGIFVGITLANVLTGILAWFWLRSLVGDLPSSAARNSGEGYA